MPSHFVVTVFDKTWTLPKVWLCGTVKNVLAVVKEQLDLGREANIALASGSASSSCSNSEIGARFAVMEPGGQMLQTGAMPPEHIDA